MRPWTGAVGAVVLLVSARGGADTKPRVSAELEAAGEVDSNPHREGEGGTEPIEAAAVARTGARLQLGQRLGRHAYRLRFAGAVKKFFGADASAEDVAVASGDGRWNMTTSDEGVIVGVRGSYYEAFERTTTVDVMLPDGGTATRSLDLDFRTGDAAGQLILSGEDGDRLTASAGWRMFHYKPSVAFDFRGPFVGLTWARSWELGDDDQIEDDPRSIEASASIGTQLRGYDGTGYTNICADYEGADDPELCLVASGRARRDLFHSASAELTYTGRRIVGLRYELHVNDSTSFGESLIRHRVELSGTSALFAGIVGTARLLVQVNQFLDPALRAGDRGTFVTIEDEGRNAILLHATRDLTDGLAIEARYAFYSNEFSQAETSYRRHVGTLGLVVHLGDD